MGESAFPLKGRFGFFSSQTLVYEGAQGRREVFGGLKQIVTNLRGALMLPEKKNQQNWKNNPQNFFFTLTREISKTISSIHQFKLHRFVSIYMKFFLK